MILEEKLVLNQTQTMDFQEAVENFSQLYDSHIQGLYAFLYYRIGHKETAEDLASQTMLRAWEKFESFDPEKASFKTWLYRIGYNSLVDYYRQNKPSVSWDNMPEPVAPQDISGEYRVGEDRKQVQKLLQTLREDERIVILMRVWDQLSYKEISEIIGKSEAASKMLFSRTMKKLRQNLSVTGLTLYLIIMNLIL